MTPIWRGGMGFRVCFFSVILLLKPSHPQKLAEYIIPCYISGPPQPPPELITDPNSFLTSMYATPAQALQLRVELRARHSLAMHLATFAGSDHEALEPIVELEQANRAIEMVTCAANRQGGEDERSVGDW